MCDLTATRRGVGLSPRARTAQVRSVRLNALRIDALAPLLESGALPTSRREPSADAAPLANGVMAGVSPLLAQLAHAIAAAEAAKEAVLADLKASEPDGKGKEGAASKSVAASRGKRAADARPAPPSKRPQRAPAAAAEADADVDLPSQPAEADESNGVAPESTAPPVVPLAPDATAPSAPAPVADASEQSAPLDAAPDEGLPAAAPTGPAPMDMGDA